MDVSRMAAIHDRILLVMNGKQRDFGLYG